MATRHLFAQYQTPRVSRVTSLLWSARDCLRDAEGKSPTYAELAQWTDTAPGTIKDWLNNKGRPTAEFLLQLLERVTEEKRQQAIDSACRLWCSLGTRRLTCDQAVISLLKTIVCLPCGLVFVQGGTDEMRTFIVTALGNAFLDLTARPHRLSGIDIHQPDWFVPLPGVRYLQNLFQPAEVLQAARENWPAADSHEAQLVVLNGLEGALTPFRKQVKELSSRHPVIVAESGHNKPALIKGWSSGPIHVLTVSKYPESTGGITVVVEAI